MANSDSTRLYGLVAEFDDQDAFLAAVHTVREAGYAQIEAYAPFAVDGLAEAVGFRRNGVAGITLLLALLAMVGTYFMQWYSAVIDFPMNIGGRAVHSWPGFIPVTAEITLMFAGIGAALGMLALNRLPKLHHPMFGARGFERATSDRFFVCVLHSDPAFDAAAVRALLTGMAPLAIEEVHQ